MKLKQDKQNKSPSNHTNHHQSLALCMFSLQSLTPEAREQQDCQDPQGRELLRQKAKEYDRRDTNYISKKSNRIKNSHGNYENIR